MNNYKAVNASEFLDLNSQGFLVVRVFDSTQRCQHTN